VRPTPTQRPLACAASGNGSGPRSVLTHRWCEVNPLPPTTKHHARRDGEPGTGHEQGTHRQGPDIHPPRRIRRSLRRVDRWGCG
jgi:hypothetical protein